VSASKTPRLRIRKITPKAGLPYYVVLGEHSDIVGRKRKWALKTFTTRNEAVAFCHAARTEKLRRRAPNAYVASKSAAPSSPEQASPL